MTISVKRLPSGYWHIRGKGVCNWTQPQWWPCSEQEIRAAAFSEAGESFLEEVVRVAGTIEMEVQNGTKSC